LSSALVFDIEASNLISLRTSSHGGRDHSQALIRNASRAESARPRQRALDRGGNPGDPRGGGSALKALGRRFRGVELEVERDPAPAQPIRLK
jgi:hypothetical protein